MTTVILTVEERLERLERLAVYGAKGNEESRKEWNDLRDEVDAKTIFNIKGE